MMWSEEQLEELRQRNRALLLQLQRYRLNLDTARKEQDSTGAQGPTEAQDSTESTQHPPSELRTDMKPSECRRTESSTKELLPRSEGCLPPLLGYDWIAGVMDTDDSLMERSEQFYTDLSTFRAQNREQCVDCNTMFSEECDPALSLRSEGPGDSHQCTFSYRINSRLFPVPLSSQECCSVCRKLKSAHPHTTQDPALVRVSVPRAAVLPPHQYTARRRRSFEPSDSLALPSHCLSGWSNSAHSSGTAQRNLDLKSSVDPQKNSELEDLPVFQVSRQKPALLPQASLLARHRFTHASATRASYLPFS